jgi:enoyl-CoA hydratase
MDESYESIIVDVSQHVAQVTLIGPGKGNAMGPAFFSEMTDVFATLDADPEVRAIVLTGSGPNFSFGLDLQAAGELFGPLLADGAPIGPRVQFHTDLLRMQKAISAVADCRTRRLRPHDDLRPVPVEHARRNRRLVHEERPEPQPAAR